MAAVFKTILHGFLIGVANIIPGVSGGSMALALGIYERLIAAVGNVGLGTLTASLGVACFRDGAKGRFCSEWRQIDGAFLSSIAAGGAVPPGQFELDKRASEASAEALAAQPAR